MRNMAEKILRQYGTDMTICSGSHRKTVRGFFQPVNSTSWQSIENEASPLGETSRA